MDSEERKRCGECGRLLPIPRHPKLSPICKLCKKPLLKAAHFWVCPDLNMSHRGLISQVAVTNAGAGKGPKEPFEV